MWTLHVKRPLHVEELLEALAVKPGSSAIDPGNKIRDKDLMTACCADLVAMDTEGLVRVAHSSVKGFLLSDTQWFQLLERFDLRPMSGMLQLLQEWTVGAPNMSRASILKDPKLRLHWSA